MQATHEQRRAFLVVTLLVTILFAGAFQIQNPRPRPAAIPVPEPVALTVPKPVKLPNFAGIRDTSMKKQTFFDFLQPYVDAKNSEVRLQRQHLLGLIEKFIDSARAIQQRELCVEVQVDEFSHALFPRLSPGPRSASGSHSHSIVEGGLDEMS